MLRLWNIVPEIKDKLSHLLRFSRHVRPYIISFVALVIGAILIGLNNPTGIILGWLAVTILMVAIVLKWRKPWYFIILLAASFFGAILLSFLCEVVALPLVKWVGGVNATDNIAWRFFHALISNIILLGTPVGLFFGAVGFIIIGIYRLFTLIRHSRAADGT